MFTFIKNLLNREKTDPVERARTFAKRHDLTFTTFNGGYHNRVQNPTTKQFVDFWNTGKMRQVNGVYSTVGHKSRRLQIDLDILIGKYPKKKK